MKPRIAIIGGGVAGLSCAAAAAETLDVTVLEAEVQPGYHASGRSAAVSIESYMNETVHALTVASRAHHLAQGARPIDDYTVADAAHGPELDRFLDRWRALCPQLREVSAADVRARVPILRPESVARAVLDPHTLALDAHALLDGYRRRLVAAGGRLLNKAQVTRLDRLARGWRVGYGDQSVEVDIVVNAAGAWGDEVGELAGARPLGLRPLRRTALLLDVGPEVSGWPMIHRVQGGLYFKPESGQLMVSLADEAPSLPCDAQPEELDVAAIAQRFEEVTTFPVRRLGRAWAGLRTFLPDGLPAVGFDPAVDGLFWLVGQGGFGMQTSPALGELAALLLAGREASLAAALSPVRLRAPLP